MADPDPGNVRSESSRKMRLGALVGAAVIFLLALIFLVYLGVTLLNGEKDSESIAPTEDTSSPYESVKGFTFKDRSQAEDLKFTYTHSDTDFPVSMVISEDSRTIVDDEFNREPTDKSFAETTLTYAFNQTSSAGEGSAQSGYTELAYGFQHAGDFYSGAISTSDGSSAKQKLLSVLNKFVSNVIASAEKAE